ncbi:MAG: fibrobacter succinogenes major paralogous domain-containing protein [Candidatus Pacebacteria bacterium]|nr:fibrobacter succinogenes major paralogous domain-containing protein [Candidatus Paceibacterota bacterium]
MNKKISLALLFFSFVALALVAFYFSNNFSQVLNNQDPYLKVALAADRTSLTFEWQKNEDDTAYYKLYHGVKSGVYGEYIKTNNNDAKLILNISKFTTYDHYFALTAVDEYGNESQKSPEIYINLDPEAIDCGNGLIDSGEICDNNFKLCEINGYVGRQDCTLDCLGWEDTCEAIEECGDAIVNGPENCESSGVVSCVSNGYLGETECNEETCQYVGACDIGSQECGNGFLEGWEECDGETEPCFWNGHPGEKGCVDCLLSDDCVKIPVCGDEYIDPGEECDSFGQGCTLGLYNGFSECGDNCVFEPCDIGGQQCGNSIKEGEEFCDSDMKGCFVSGYSGQKECLDNCLNYGNCETDQFCGDEIVNGNEECDKNGPSSVQSCTDPDGYPDGEKVCLNDCSDYGICDSPLFCGDNILTVPLEKCELEQSEDCETPDGYEGEKVCLIDCSDWGACITDQFCGDEIVNGNEECDKNGPSSVQSCTDPDGYPDGEKVCLNDCSDYGICNSPWFCGDNITTVPVETCDGDTIDCELANGYAGVQECKGNCQGYENCQATEECGDGEVNGPEECEIGDTQVCVNGDGYRGSQACLVDCSGWSDCISELECGDDITTTPPETCDGDTIDCELANGYAGTQDCKADCQGYENCQAIEECGDGEVNGPEECEIGGTQACFDDDGYEGVETCLGDCSDWGECIIFENCGDGVINGPEVCDINSSNNCTAYNGEDGQMPCLPDCSGYASDMCCPEKIQYDGGPWNQNLTVKNGGGYYRSKLIGDQCWFIDNLNSGSPAAPIANDNEIQKYCYNYSAQDCRDLGGLYKWSEAMQDSNIEGSQGACPNNWHVPSNLEFNILELKGVEISASLQPQGTCDLSSGGSYRCGDAVLQYYPDGLGAGRALKSESVAGYDLLGFEALLGGQYYWYGDEFRYKNQQGLFFTSSPVLGKTRVFTQSASTHNYIRSYTIDLWSYASVRCIMNED